MEESRDDRHLSDAEFFSLALPPTGQPEALPQHLGGCLSCSRALAEWKAAVRDLAQEDVAPIAARSRAQWAAAEERTLAAIRTTRPARPRRRLWSALGAVAALLVAALLLVHSRRPEQSRAVRPGDAAEWSAQDRADDALLRDVARLSRGEEAGTWNTLAPDPKSGAEEDRL